MDSIDRIPLKRKGGILKKRMKKTGRYGNQTPKLRVRRIAGRPTRRTPGRYDGNPSDAVVLWLLAACFLLGIIAGQVLSGRMPLSAAGELRQHLTASLPGQDGTIPSVAFSASLVWTYLRYPLLAAGMGLTSLGIILLWIISVFFGFFLSFSVGCFELAFGKSGLLLAAASLGIRALTTIPCFFLLAVPAFRFSWQRFHAVFWTGGVPAPENRRVQMTRLRICAIILFTGICLEFLLTPRLVYLAAVYALKP